MTTPRPPAASPAAAAARPERSAAGAAFERDLARYGAHPFLREWSIYAVAVYRFGQWNDTRRGPLKRVLTQAYWAAHRVVMAVTHIEIPKEARIGAGLRIHHTGPVVVHPASVVGEDCTIRQGVTIGERRTGGGAPRLGSAVELGAYAQVLGAVTLGDRVKVGALALVLDDVPDDGVAVAPRAVIR